MTRLAFKIILTNLLAAFGHMSLLIEHLSFSYENQSILHDLSLTLKTGEISALIGSSGSGKTTLFKLIAGLLPMQKGQILINGSPLSTHNYPLAYMMQQDFLLPWRTVMDNVLLVAELGTSSNRQAYKAFAYQLLEAVGLSHYINAYPDELSGGMRQRVALARSLLLKRPLLLLDEPFGALDVGLREHLYHLLHRIRDQYGTTILLVTHDFRDALALSDHLFLLAEQRIDKEWTLSAALKADFTQIGLLQNELKSLLIYSPNA
jgi:ABC-type nitrate/sulfonate/bicarbonate transport system ATPase subunit